MKTMKWVRYGVLLTTIIALLVVVLGAYTRLTDSGLGCPDWPGCYGRLVVPEVLPVSSPAVLEPRKAWTEMIHRYAAGTLAVCMVVLIAWLVQRRRRQHAGTWWWPLLLISLLAFQAALGRWTVTLKLLPLIVMGHLLGGMLIFMCLVRVVWQFSGISGNYDPKYNRWILFSMVVVFMQVILGGLVSSNDAGIACIGFPTCNGHWLPAWRLTDNGLPWREVLGFNVGAWGLDPELKILLQWLHRAWATLTLVTVLLVSGYGIICSKELLTRALAWVVFLLIILQFMLGILNVIYLLPLPVAVAHNGVAALLLGALISLHYSTLGTK